MQMMRAGHDVSATGPEDFTNALNLVAYFRCRGARKHALHVDAAMAENETFLAYVHRLEAEAPPPLPTRLDPRGGDRLISEIEQFLRERPD